MTLSYGADLPQAQTALTGKCTIGARSWASPVAVSSIFRVSFGKK